MLLTALIFGTLAAAAPAALRAQAPPLAQPEDVTVIHDSSAQLSGTVSPMGLPTAYVFEWGPTPAYGSVSPLVILGERTMPLRVKFNVTGLQPGTRYHWRLVAANALGHAFGENRSFTTDGEGEGSGQGEEDPAAATPPPQRSASAVASGSGGTVRIRKPGQKGFVALDAAASIPFGSVIDARRGKVRVVTAIDAAGTTQAATFKRGMFELRQPASGDGTVDVILRGGRLARRCRTGRALARAARVPRDRKRVVRRLWGSDRHGKFRMHGRNSVATVRGTRWEMVDRCDGTLTRVFSGAVDVRDRRTGRTVRVRGGRAHLNRLRA